MDVMNRKKLMFPNTNKIIEEEPKITEKEVLEQQTSEEKKIREHIDLLEKEKRLEEERKKRIRQKARKMSEAQLRKSIRKRQAISMRMRNIPVDIIAEKLGVTQRYAANLIKEAVAELPEETADDLKKLIGRTVVQLIGQFEKTALQGGVREAEVMLKGISQLMRLTGLSIQKQQVDQTTMSVGNLSDGIDVADLNLDLDTKRRILEAIRERKEKDSQQEKSQEEVQEIIDDQHDDNEEMLI